MHSAWFHEDEYGQVEVLPDAAAGWCLAEMARIDAVAVAHRTDYGFTDCYLRAEPPVGFAAVGLRLADLRTSLEGRLRAFDRVLYGYGSHAEVSRATVGWGDGTGQAVFADVSDGETVTGLWLSVWGVPPTAADRWARALVAVPGAGGLILADWDRSRLVPLADPASLAAYFGDPGR